MSVSNIIKKVKIMADWGLLNKQFDEVLNNFSDKDWNNWALNRIKNKETRRQVMLRKATIQQSKIASDEVNVLDNCSSVELDKMGLK
ncbi:MAG: hypothetical protein V5804_12495 [Mucilaginibacter sp.]|uniref:hypothetical protein n=1 Tax=Mucilaginibacter sp. TaxID=1882438 RepID=UPI0034E588AC